MKKRIAASLFFVLALVLLFTSCSIGKRDQRFITVHMPYTDYTIDSNQIDSITISWNIPSIYVHLISDKGYSLSLEEGKKIYDALGIPMPQREE